MDAYSDYVRQLADTKLAGLRKEAAEERLARSLATRRTATGKARRAWFGLGARRRRNAPGRMQPDFVTEPQPRFRRAA